jgi:hypothetical protein
MKIDNVINLEDKVEIQQKIINDIEADKKKLLDKIEALNFEKDFDHENNEKSVELAKSLIEDISEQQETLQQCLADLNSCKREYQHCMSILQDTVDNYNLAIKNLIENIDIKHELSLAQKIQLRAKMRRK